MNAEKALIGCILLGQNQAEIFADITEKDFIFPKCRQLFSTLHSSWQRFGTADAGCVPNELCTLAAECVDFVPPMSAYKAYIRIAKQDAAKQRAYELAQEIAGGSMSVEEIHAAAADMTQSLQKTVSVRRMSLQNAVQAFCTAAKQPPVYLKTGFATLDKTAYIQRGDYVVIGARPSGGKTAFALALARSFAAQGIKTVFYSYETTIEKMAGRTIAAHCRMAMSEVKAHSSSAAAAAKAAENELGELPFEFVECAGKPISWIKSDVQNCGAQAVFIDYIGLAPSRGDSRFEKVTASSLAIREMCQNTGVAAFVLCQINRQGKGEPCMEDLKESGQIEQDADLVLLLHNPQELKLRRATSRLELIVAKNKEGQTGCINMYFSGERQVFWQAASEGE